MERHDLDSSGLERAADGAGNCQSAGSVAVKAQGVGTDRDARAVYRDHLAIADKRECLGDRGLGPADERAGLIPPHERAVRLIGPIDECLCGHWQSGSTPGVDERRSRETHETQCGERFDDRFRDGVGEDIVASCLVVQRAVGLHVRYRKPEALSHGDEPRDLSSDQPADGVARECKISTTGELAIGVARMCAH